MVNRSVSQQRRSGGRIRSADFFRARVESLEQRLLLSITPAHLVDPHQSPYEAALEAFHGPDLVGKDGPLAKLGFDLALLYEEQTANGLNDSSTSSNSLLVISGTQVSVSSVANVDLASFKSQLASLGATNIQSAGALVSSDFPIANLAQLAALNSLAFAQPNYRPGTAAGSVDGQPDQAVRADLARTTFGVDGSGITVGVMSDSFNRLTYANGVDAMSRDIQTGDLPVSTQVLQELPALSGSVPSDEGRALAQVVHDAAPGAAIQFATGFTGQVGMANNIRSLATAGSDVIVDDVFYFADPFFQDGVISQAIQQVVNAGVAYFTLAGNHGDDSYERAFTSSGVAGPGGGTLHDFDSGPGISTLQQVSLPVGVSVPFSFQWDQPFRSLGGTGSASDLDFYVLGSDGTTVLASGIDQNVGGDALEIVNFLNDGTFDLDANGVADTKFFVRIELVSGPAPNLLKYIALDNGAPFSIDTFATDSSTVYGHSNTRGAIGVGAAAYFQTPSFGLDPPALNDFSSLGGTPLLFDATGNRLASPIFTGSPQLVGVDAGNTTFFGFDSDADGLPNFFGTSASAPNVAAVASLMLDAAGGEHSLTPADIYDALMSTAIDIQDRASVLDGTLTPIADGEGVDDFSGNGLVDALRAVQLVSTGISINDVAEFEGNGGTTAFVFTITLAGAAAVPVTVGFATANGSALAGADYVAQSGTVTFTPGGPTQQTLTIQVVGEELVESDETFLVKLIDPVNASLIRSQATGTIKNDDVDLSINDVTITEGDAGTKNAVFTIAALGSTDRTVAVSYTTLNGTAIAGSDFLHAGGAATFAPGGGTVAVTVPIIGDKLNESTETFTVQLLSPQGSRLAKGVGIGTILDNDLVPGLYVNDVFLTTTSPDVLAAVFTVALGAPSGQLVTVEFATADGTALAGVDYVAQAGTLTFAPGTTTQLVTVPVVTSGVYSPNEKFALNLFNPFHAELGDPQGIATIIFADPPTDERIIDDGDPGYSKTAGWVNLTNTLSYQLDYDYHAAGTGANFATWNFGSLPNGEYEVFAKWSAFGNRASNAPYTILDGSTPLGTVLVNQQSFPTGDQSNGITWQSLGLFSISNGSLAVRLGDNANGLVVADAIRIVADGIPPAEPEMDVAGSDRSIGTFDFSPSADDSTDFGEVASNSNSATQTFTISNNGNADLHLTGAPRVLIAGADAGDFTVLVQPGSSIAPGFQSTFQIIFHPSDTGLREAVILIANDDDSEHPYAFAVQGTGVATGPAQLTVDDLTSGFTAFGGWPANVNSLSFAGLHRSAAAGSGDSNTSWAFHDLAPGLYEVLTTWTPFINRATNASYVIADGNVAETAIGINQRQSPNDAFADGVMWESLALFQVTTGELTVRLNNNANGFVVADAVRIIRQGAAIAEVAPVVAHNSQLSLDVNGDTRITSSDALLVVNRLLSHQPAVSPLAAVALPLATAAGADSTYYLDVNADGHVTARDALMVISYLLNPSAQTASASPAISLATDPSSATALAAVATPAAVDLAIGQLDEPELEPAVLPSTNEAVTPPAAAAEQPAGKTTQLLTPQSVRAYFATSAKKSPTRDLSPAAL